MNHARRNFVMLAAASLCGTLVFGCARTTSPGARAGETQRPPSPSPRVVSLAPSLTEIAFSIGCGSALVGDTAFDDYPAAAKALPHVGDLVHADLERIAQLSPTIVLALHDQELEGSAVSTHLHVPVVYLPNRNIQDLYADIDGVAEACQRRAQGTALSAQLRARIDAVMRQTERRTVHPRVFYLLGLPGFTAGKRSYLDDAIRIAGGINVAGDVDQPYPDFGEEAILRADPDVIIVSKSARFNEQVRAREPWRSLRAVQSGRVLSPPDDSILERDGPRIVDGVEWMSAALR